MRRVWVSSRRERWVCAAAIALAGCAGGAAEDGAAGTGAAQAGTGADASFATTVQPLFDQACNCHQSTPMLMAPFSLKHGEAYGNLVDTPSMQLPTMPLVEPGALNESYLWHKVNGTQLEVGGQGMIMPYTVPLVADELAVIERWIAAGAPP